MGVILLVIVAYLAGSVPWGLVIAKVFCGIDPRLDGSRNTGATNVARLCGFGWGVLTLLCDLGKGALPVACAVWLGYAPEAISVIGIAAIGGHVFSCFMHFRGGKAVSTTIGVFLPIAFWPLLVASLCCILVIWRIGYISAGSLTLVGVLPIALVASGQIVWLPLSLVAALIVVWKHKENIQRLLNGTEKPWLKKKQ